MADITITNSQVNDYDEAGDVNSNAADETTDETKQTFVYTPTAAASGILVRVDTSASVLMNVVAGDGVFAGQDYSETLTDGDYIILLDLGKYVNSDGEVDIEFTPTESAEDLTNDAALKVEVLEIDIDTQ